MDRIPQQPPVILPLADEVNRPLWSVMIPVYNCSDYLREALNSVLAQDPGADQMQIEVVDDASTDADVAALVTSIGNGRVLYYRQPQNVGSLRNFETCINRAKGQLVHLLHGDDRTRPGFYQKMSKFFSEYPEIGAAFSRFTHIDDKGNPLSEDPPLMDYDGIIPDWLFRIAQQQRLQYACKVVKRSVYEKLGSFYGVTYGEDWEMWVRIAKYYPVAYTPEVLAEYRVHNDSISNTKTLAGQTVRDLKFLSKVISEHLPASQRKEVSRKSTRIWAGYELGKASALWDRTHNYKQVENYVKGILDLHTDVGILLRVCKLYAKMAIQTVVPPSKPASSRPIGH
ncbi:glycosyltransferase family 2 protein [Spirosoma fluviale]|uniref:Glycosyl transferase family 2 n=1 Tax=Spirosoma fluviale TaxID=1597977 RepID=A0A286FIA2_9BACT|nr:glycosyltransferase [Spirosoma fluviale]SOD82971.1 Glycosyl transferase family 2 [Spirosoma fluviale]